jgi:TrmH family RNA methyltransferase
MISGRDWEPLSKARRSLIADLADRGGRERHGLFLLEGPRAIEDALGRGVKLASLVANDFGEKAVARWFASGLVPESTALYRAGDGDIERLADTTTPQGILAVGELPAGGLDTLPVEPGRMTLLADGIQDPGNLGTLLRTLAAVGGKAAICCAGTVDPFNPKALRGSAGATLSLAIARGVDREAAVGWCAERGVAIVALAAAGSDLFAARLPEGPLALAVGNEAAGLSPEIERAATLVAGIPMDPAVESLSAAVAGSVALVAIAYHLVRGGGGA